MERHQTYDLIRITTEIYKIIEQWMIYVLEVPLQSYETECERVIRRSTTLRMRFEDRLSQFGEEVRRELTVEVRDILLTFRGVICMEGVIERSNPQTLREHFDETERKYQSYILEGQLVRIQRVIHQLSHHRHGRYH